LLRLVDGISPYFVHLIRDPRAVAYSRQRVKSGPHGPPMRRFGAFYVASRWVARNVASHLVRLRYGADRSLLVRYEDFVASPRSTVQTIAEFVGERPRRLPFLDERTARLGVNHTVFGNPSRFEMGTVKLRLDEEWRTGQRRMDWLVATLVSLPLLRRYGYPVLPGASTTRA
ncbi:MAG: sulfotransferase, partial [Gemmatimonadetes bacterium]|nr:sulfotransferase [Gemmatimonadota bacterium]